MASGYNKNSAEKGATGIHQINLGREAIGLPTFVQKDRTCLKCDVVFLSKGSHNRCCPSCDPSRIRSEISKRGMSKKQIW